ncbi:mitogen-activated protein kinase kinase kinase 20-like [Apium graveolens]|uniref:mitogen-activated protein kinase kinase kinase 20-like n=1 Tax=Apium graveolens TaxID=4045 RepID=UPI003D792002
MMEIKAEDDVYVDKAEQNKLLCKRNKYGDGVAWFRGALLGKGSFGSVFLATLKKPKLKFRCFPPLMAIKSAEVSVSGSIQKEREVLSNIGRSDYVIRCFGDEITTADNGGMVYNLLLEYGSGGTLANVVGDGGLDEFDVKRYTRDLVRGIYHIHSNGYVHCDLKPDNVLLVGNCGGEYRAKICDLGLAKRVMRRSDKKRKLDPYFRGTPLYLSPEVLAGGVQEPASDIWALGCIVIEMLTGKSPWEGIYLDGGELLERIAEGREMPRISNEISVEAKNFLKRCLVRKPMYRWTAEMLLNHPFLEGLVDVDKAEEYEEVSDVNADSSFLLLPEADEELGFSFWEDDSFVSEEESVSCYSEEEVNNVEVIDLAREGTLKIQESADTASSRSDSEFNHATRKPVPLDTRHQYSIAFTIPAGV